MAITSTLAKIKGSKNYVLDSILINGVYHSLITGQSITAADKLEVATSLATFVQKLGSGFVISNSVLLAVFGNQIEVNKFIFCVMRMFSGTTPMFVLEKNAPDVDTLRVNVDISTVTTALATLGAPTLTNGTIAATTVVLNWAAIDGADGYIIEKATNVGFTTGVATIYTGALLTTTATGLTTATNYWFRARATGTGFTTSAYSTKLPITTS